MNENSGIHYVVPNKPALNQGFPKIEKSTEILNKAKKIMHPVTQTLAKGPGQYSKGMAPVYLDRGKGCHATPNRGSKTRLSSLISLSGSPAC